MNDYDWWFALLNINTRLKIGMLQEYKSTEKIWYNFKYNVHYSKYFDMDRINYYKNIITKNDISVITYNDEKYPERLKFYEDAPYILFYKGNIDKINSSFTISIVGSRNCSFYGKNVTRNISRTLAENNITVISGMAKGIDSEAHRVTIESGGFTCAVLGCGIDVVYPKENVKLYNSILEKGCIISEFLPGTPPNSYNFPIRNRIISGLGDILIIVEAGLKSGSLITASLALEQGKEVIAVPGSIFSEQSKGTNKLIQDGAHSLLNIEDINYVYGKDIIKKNLKNEKLKDDKLEIKLLDIIDNDPIHIDDIIKLCNIDINKLYELLFQMQSKKQIMRLTGNYYVKINDNI